MKIAVLEYPEDDSALLWFIDTEKAINAKSIAYVNGIIDVLSQNDNEDDGYSIHSNESISYSTNGEFDDILIKLPATIENSLTIYIE